MKEVFFAELWKPLKINGKGPVSLGIKEEKLFVFLKRNFVE